MKRWKYLFLFVFLTLVSCKADKINGNSIKEFHQSVNHMSSGLKTIRQVKFREALYIIERFVSDSKDDIERINLVISMLNGKKLNEVFYIADSIANSRGINWSSDAPPSLDYIDLLLNNVSDSININRENILTPLNEIPQTLVYIYEPKEFVAKFLQNISKKKLFEAYKMSDNADWESFDIFSNSDSGFGVVKSISIKNIYVDSETLDETSVTAEYIVVDKENRELEINASFILRIHANSWKITHYKVNSTHRL